MQINKIIKLAIKRLESEGKLLTPDFYAEAFCKEAKKAGIKVEDCEHVEKLSQTLTPELKKEIKNYRLNTLAELTRFLIAKIKRLNQTKCSEILESQVELNRKSFEALKLLHNIQARELAQKSIELLNSSPSKAQLDHFKQLWENFINNYDDTFLYALNSLGKVYENDLEKTINNLKINAKEIKENKNELQQIASLLINSLTPSIASSINKNISSVINNLRKNPDILKEESFEKELQQAIAARIALDKKSVSQMVRSLETILDKLSLKLINMIEKSEGSSSDIKKIKQELEAFTKDDETNFHLTHKKLYTIAIALEETTIEFKNNLQDHSNEVQALQEKVKILEEELKKAKDEASIDFLTKVYNKRALDNYLEIKEGEYKRFSRNYSIVMFDIDHFKNVNDTYGHDAGDAVLSAFASIIKKEARTVDIIGRFGGEEFMGILSETDTKGSVIFAEKVRKHVQKARFMYKGTRIPITVSIGVCERKTAPSLEQTIKCADERLYKAKKGGRNQVVYK